jgi:Tol biopolymer transport system component
MPDVQEVFRMATNKVKPDPQALERQLRRQRQAARSSRARAYLAVAAVIAVIAVGAFAILRIANNEEGVPGHNESTGPSSLSFVTTLPLGADAQTAAIVDLKGHQTATVAGMPVDGFAPSLSTDGSTIAFVAAPSELGYNQVSIMGANGSDPHFVSTPGIIVSAVAISPDGSRVAFEGLSSGMTTDIYVVGVDGSGLQQLTTDPATDQYPQWSPDGTTIVYDNAGKHERTADPQFSKTAEIFTVPADGGTPTQLTHNNGTDAAPSYSPDGRTIVYQSFRGFWLMDADGGNESAFRIRIGGFTPRWSPDGRTIAFSYYKDVSDRPRVQLGDGFGDRPLVIVAVADVASHRITRLTRVGMATDSNTPQWVDDGHLLILRVPVPR